MKKTDYQLLKRSIEVKYVTDDGTYHLKEPIDATNQVTNTLTIIREPFHDTMQRNGWVENLRGTRNFLELKIEYDPANLIFTPKRLIPVKRKPAPRRRKKR